MKKKQSGSGKRKFGEIPAWAKDGPVDAKNYDWRVEWHGAKIRMWGDNWPFLSNDPELPGTADADAWDLYFRDHVGGFPMTYRLFRDGVIQYLNMPEAKPELFDTSYQPKVMHPPQRVYSARGVDRANG